MLDLRVIGSLGAEHCFLVPDYQRGYRWGRRNVLELLQDLWAFAHQPPTARKSLYCLQPIVVKPLKASSQMTYELVDGQQRLTTLYLLQAYLRQAQTTPTECFAIHYETRARSRAFLKELPQQPDHPERHDNLDFYHMAEAYATIQAFFEEKEYQPAATRFEEALYAHTAVIWYELSSEANAHEVFQRLNSGQIRLTNAELVKALFLSTGGDVGTAADQLLRQRLALEWEQIENQLQNDAFWYFLADREERLEQRIEFIFGLVADDINGNDENPIDIPRTDPLYIFLTFNRYFQNHSNRAENWQRVKRYVLRFSDWYEHNRLYHYVGFLRAQQLDPVSLAQLVDWWTESSDKRVFERRLLSVIEDILPSNLKDLTYNPHNSRPVRAYLLWFNIVALLHQPNHKKRFQFDVFKQQRWDIEHIRSAHTELPTTSLAQRQWLWQLWEFLSGAPRDAFEARYQTAVTEAMPAPFYQQLCDWLLLPETEPVDRDDFTQFYTTVVEHFEEVGFSEHDIHRIGNLCLLDSSTNRSYRNALFPVKRKAIIQLDSEGHEVLPGTKHVFLKYYSSKLDNMLQWTAQDMDDYERALKKVLHFDTLEQQWYGEHA